MGRHDGTAEIDGDTHHATLKILNPAYGLNSWEIVAYTDHVTTWTLGWLYPIRFRTTNRTWVGVARLSTMKSAQIETTTLTEQWVSTVGSRPEYTFTGQGPVEEET